jgi:Uma2 family endonuclease
MTSTISASDHRSTYRPTHRNRRREISRAKTWVWDRPITFDEFLDLYLDRGEFVELIDGSVVEKDMVQYDHGKCEAWLVTVLRLYVNHLQMGTVLSSRIAMRISDFRGRLPDIFFVRRENEGIIQLRGVYGVPDVVMEVRSPSDRKAHLVALETDYRTLGVPEIVFIDLAKRQIRLLCKRGDSYVEQTMTTGALELAAIPGLASAWNGYLTILGQMSSIC